MPSWGSGNHRRRGRRGTPETTSRDGNPGSPEAQILPFIEKLQQDTKLNQLEEITRHSPWNQEP